MVDARRRLRAALRRMYNAALLGCGLLLALPLRIISPVYRVEVQPLLVERIGHLAIEPEMLLSLRQVNPPTRSTTLFYSRGPVCNHFLLTMWRRVLTCGPAWILHPMWVANLRFPWLDLGARGWEEQHFDLRLLDETGPHLWFTDDDLVRGRELLHSLGLGPDEPFVCLSVRDKAYLSKWVPTRNWTYHDYRDSNISTYQGLAEMLADSGLTVLRMGAEVEAPFASTHPRVIDYASSGLRSDFGDVYLFSRCQMSISSSTGVDSLAMTFRRPMGIVNLPGTGGLQLGGPLRLVMFKDLVDATTGEPLPLLDPRRPEAMAAFRTDKFADLGLRLVDNSPEQLVGFGREMLQMESGEWHIDDYEQVRERAFLRFIDPGRDLSDASFHIARCWLVKG